MPELSDGLVIRGVSIRNRIVMPPMVCFSFKGFSEGLFSRQHVEHYAKRAKGGAGLIIVQSTSVSGAAEQTGVWSAGQRGLLEAIAGNCRSLGAAVMLQLSCGNVDVNQLSAAQIHAMQADCAAAAGIAKQAGFDGVEYHFAHGFTLCKFLDPEYNKRTDAYGGSLQNRVRVLAEILPQVRRAGGENFIIGVRMGCNIPEEAGAAEVAKALEAAGVDLLHVSSGMRPPAFDVPEGFIASALAYGGSLIKKRVRIPVIGVGGIYTAMEADFLIRNGYLELVAVGRGMLADENWAARVLAGEPVNRCRDCKASRGSCFWFTDHTLCPAGKKEGAQVQSHE